MSNLNFLHSGGNKVTLSAPASNPSSDITFKLPQSDGSSGQAIVTDGSGALSFTSVPPAVEADQWYLNSNVTSTIDPITDWVLSLKVATGMSLSSGVFTFPSTGKWLITANVLFRPQPAPNYDNMYFDFRITTDGGSSFIHATRAQSSGAGYNHLAQNGTGMFFFDVTNTSTHKIKFTSGSIASGSYIHGQSSLPRYTNLVFQKLGVT